jgi:hypothetical protein
MPPVNVRAVCPIFQLPLLIVIEDVGFTISSIFLRKCYIYISVVELA